AVAIEEHPHRRDKHRYKADDRDVDARMQTARDWTILIGAMFRHGALPLLALETRPKLVAHLPRHVVAYRGLASGGGPSMAHRDVNGNRGFRRNQVAEAMTDWLR